MKEVNVELGVDLVPALAGGCLEEIMGHIGEDA
jgi:hypothetical protein